MSKLVQTNFKVGDNVIKRYGISIIGKIISKDKGNYYIIFPGIGNTIMEYSNEDIELCNNKSSETYNQMIIKEYDYWKNINKEYIDNKEMILKNEFNTSNFLLKRPSLLNGLLENNNYYYQINEYDEPKYLDHHIDKDNVVWIKLFFSEKRVVGWIQSYKVKFKYRIINDLFSKNFF